MDEMQIPIGHIVAQTASGNIPRVPGSAVFAARLTHYGTSPQARRRKVPTTSMQAPFAPPVDS
jgi:hypothetical protein